MESCIGALRSASWCRRSMPAPTGGRSICASGFAMRGRAPASSASCASLRAEDGGEIAPIAAADLPEIAAYDSRARRGPTAPRCCAIWPGACLPPAFVARREGRVSGFVMARRRPHVGADRAAGRRRRRDGAGAAEPRRGERSAARSASTSSTSTPHSRAGSTKPASCPSHASSAWCTGRQRSFPRTTAPM